MCGYLVIDGWNSRQKVPVNIIGETADGFEIEAIERVFLPGRGILKEGQSAFVPKITVKLNPAVGTGLAREYPAKQRAGSFALSPAS